MGIEKTVEGGKRVSYVDIPINDFPGICLGDDDAVYGGCCVGHCGVCLVISWYEVGSLQGRGESMSKRRERAAVYDTDVPDVVGLLTLAVRSSLLIDKSSCMGEKE
jgi:hypothetical protein